MQRHLGIGRRIKFSLSVRRARVKECCVRDNKGVVVVERGAPFILPYNALSRTVRLGATPTNGHRFADTLLGTSRRLSSAASRAGQSPT